MAAQMKATNEALEKVKDQLECAICLQAYTDPKLLSCFHVFCAHCLTQLVVKNQDGSTVTCPECRRPTPLLHSGVTGLQSAFHIHRLFNIRDTLEKVREPQKAHCDNLKCNKAAATGYCRDCVRFVCEKCKMAHELLDELATHQVVSITNIQADTTSLVPPKKVMYCPKHREKKLKIYCETCQELVCSDCTISLHPRETHQYALIADVFSKHRDEILDHLKPVRNNLETVNRALQAVDQRRKEISDQRQVVEADIHRRIDQLHEALDQRRAELVGKLDQFTQQKLKNLDAQKGHIEMLKIQLSSCLEYVEGSLKAGTEGEILAMKGPVVRQVQQIIPEINPDTLHPQEKANLLLVEDDAPWMTEACRKLATVTGTRLDPTQYYSAGGGLKAATVGENTEVTLHTRDQAGKDITFQTADITAELVCSRDNTKVKCNVTKVKGNKCIIRYQPATRGKHHLHITIGGTQTRGSPHTVVVVPKVKDLGKPVRVMDGLGHPWGVVTNSEGMLIIAEEGADCVSVLTHEGEKVRSFKGQDNGSGQFNRPRGITVDAEDNVYVVDSLNHRIQKFTVNGEHISSVGSRGGHQLQFMSPVDIGFNHTNSKLYVCDQSNHRVQVLNTNLEFSKQFGSKGNGKGQFQCPVGTSFDGNGNVYIADCANHRVQVFTPDGNYLRQFGSQGSGCGQLLYPSSVAVDQDRVFVTEQDNHRVSVFTTTGQFVHSFGAKGQEPGQLSRPWNVAIDKNGFIFVSDRDNNRIQVF